MARWPDASLGRIVRVLVLLGLIVVLIGASYLIFAHRPAPTEVGPDAGGGEPPGAVNALEAKRLAYILALLLVSVLLILAFIIGSYLLIRVGRSITRESVGGKATRYVDAWRQYRLTPEQIRDLTQEVDRTDVDDTGNAGEDRPEGSDQDR